MSFKLGVDVTCARLGYSQCVRFPCGPCWGFDAYILQHQLPIFTAYLNGQRVYVHIIPSP